MGICSHASSWRNCSRRHVWAAGVTTAALVATKTFLGEETTNNEAETVGQGGTGDNIPSFQGLSPTLPIYIFRPNKNVEIAFDTRTKNPVYVMERLSTCNGQQASSVKLKRPHFYEEKSLPEEFRSRPSHYRNSGYDRGHLAAAANYINLSQQELHDTYNLVNVCPQNHSMNTSIWSRLELWTRRVAQENSEHFDEDTYVVTGPLWLPAKKSGEKLFEFQYNAIGTVPSLISVPTHLFKIVVAIPRETSDGNHNTLVTKFACFVIPNEEFVTKNKQRSSLEHFLVPWSDLEAVTGLHFFPGLTVDWKAKANRLTNDIMTKIQGRAKPLLLTDGSESKPKWGWGGKKRGPQELAHMCANGSCS